MSALRTSAEVTAELDRVRQAAVLRVLAGGLAGAYVSALVDLQVYPWAVGRVLEQMRDQLPAGETRLVVDVNPAGMPKLMLTMGVVVSR